MQELYWLTTISRLSDLGTVLIFLAISASIILFVWFHNESSDINFSLSRDDSEAARATLTRRALRILRLIAAAVILGTLLLVFVPSKRDLCIIYGVGGTIDYIKQSPSAKQIPDKCIKALNNYLDECAADDK